MSARPQILCVDDEAGVLEGLALNLGRRYAVQTATSGKAALELLQRESTLPAIILSDMRMPEMDGARFLGLARLAAPDAVRMLLTGQSDYEDAIAAVNQGQLFRFLTKPCPAPLLLKAFDEALAQHQLLVAERQLFEQTLRGSVEALTDVLALTSPTSSGRATRIKRHVAVLADRLKLRERWQVEVAAMLSQLGTITLPPETVDKIYCGGILTEAEQKMVARVPAVTDQLLAHIPRLETVRKMLKRAHQPWTPGFASSNSEDELVERGGEILKVAIELEELEAEGQSAALAVQTVLGRAGRHDPAVVEALWADEVMSAPLPDVRELPLVGVRAGMVFADDVRMANGALLVARGYQATASFVERVQNFRPGYVREPVRVIVRAMKAREIS